MDAIRFPAVIVVLLVCFSHPVVAQVDSAQTKLDTLISGQKKMIDLQEKIYGEVKYDDPLINRQFGIELNPALLLVAAADHYFALSAGVSLFSVTRKAEIAFPIWYREGSGKDYPLTHLNLDANFRYFLGRHQNGFYFSGAVRYTHIRGREPGFDLIFFTIPNASGEIITTDKVGVHFGIGYRYFSESGLFWGVSLVYGRYFSDDARGIEGVGTDDTKTILDIEFFKFGIAF